MAQKVVAMILAGGKGTRLKALTKKIAKPAVHFGGKYRIIDFSLSNVANSDITVCGRRFIKLCWKRINLGF